ncbi:MULTISPECIES: glycosyltransferase family 2 protein [unclassified Oceanobacter]|uniref:glycosyltransferase family 2 protein n=1 Tax=unclassified Oceanobacter TaxID=2620260 RepID=UPI0026E4898E|nr:MULTISPECIES: glycosyltransferase family 2 protein [unclassified Oceanobacter]MDO6683437.1 glycosyltransferase family 2 protein [Oceanobacter sp. 5_MG-2023]MDP2507091.1 glycosyltransferase family 2 protein [Oceanobacter sp. 3_MG-2023]MDP2548849.1 glycosyltransferase family 2 protein [Oceanobacter sp. 4_MG-2023]MDP2609612.1 glycosyltransferase family 2 protein [Oceanobacter sp. 1_MG-2023]MDP2612695.1 glycosyltransferase family 2 protein [Oceanobacter sp. 2_MG-2023]
MIDCSKPSLSIVIPMYNEIDNVGPMVARVHEALISYQGYWELLVVDDGSNDGTPQALHREAEQYGPHVRVIELRRNFGQTAAMQAGIDEARGEMIATLDGDLQNDPADIPRMIDHLIEKDLDLLTGWRKNRKDDLVMRKIPSRIANRLIGKITGVRINDYGCSLKVYRAAIIKQVRLYGEMHRFIPAWVAAVVPPSRIGEIVVTHNARTAGTSKYGISRTFRVILDLLSVYFFMRYRARPGHFFGMIGLGMGSIGTLLLMYLAVIKFGFGEDIGSRPLFLIAVVCVIAALQFLTTGVMSELISRTYFESSQRQQHQYIIYNRDGASDDKEACWAAPGQVIVEASTPEANSDNDVSSQG